MGTCCQGRPRPALRVRECANAHATGGCLPLRSSRRSLRSGLSPTLFHDAQIVQRERNFYEARPSSPAEATLILQMILRLYQVEDRARPLDEAARRALRQEVPILERLREELDRLSTMLLPKSGLAQAMTYAMNQWPALCRYNQDGRLSIDNNAAESRLRDQAIGRKNWLFFGERRGRSASRGALHNHCGGEAVSA